MKPRHCLATVTSDAFAIGTIVMVHSFRRHNPWFDGDVIAFYDALGSQMAALLSRIDGLRLVPVSPAFHDRVAGLIAARPELASRCARFASIEAFGLNGYDRVMFCDSDLLFRADVSDLFERREPFVAVGDSAWQEGLGRDRTSFDKVARDASGAISPSFNAGLMLIDGALAGSKVHGALLDGLEPSLWSAVVTPHTDQIVFNRHFAGQVSIAGPDYNRLLMHDVSFGEARDARVLHFNGAAKPWAWHHHPQAVRRSPVLIEAYRQWHASYLDWLAAQHLAAGEWVAA
ncbi:glycosyltransferase [Sphingomonas canadensis]|uniref:Glycosyltransferase n=1 Tax=Sphingomonas canadensis TaxID=1219257 RepID=A0ABW3H715_9SPHN|nr:glycosyltransferase [Sphingomonas canadensis]MCW3836916.1 hypothetical protein [Sphingomonas canadensis]